MRVVKFQKILLIIIALIAQFFYLTDGLYAQEVNGIFKSDNKGVEYDNESVLEPDNEEEYFIGIMLWKSIHIYQDNVDGLRKGLKESGLKFDWELLNAYKNEEKAYKILDYFVDSNKSLIISFGSWGSVIASEYNVNIPVVVLGVNSPVPYGLADNNNMPSSNMTGSSYYIDPIKQISYFKEIYPQLKTLGIVYSSRNAASHAEVPATEEACVELGIELIKEEIHNDISDPRTEPTLEIQIKQAVSRLINNVDAVLIPTNSELYRNAGYLLEVTEPAQKPLFSCSLTGVQNGALAGLCSDNFKMGYKTAGIIVDILKNKKNVSEIPFVFDDSPRRIINMESAVKIGLVLPEEIVNNTIDVKDLRKK